MLRVISRPSTPALWLEKIADASDTRSPLSLSLSFHPLLAADISANAGNVQINRWKFALTPARPFPVDDFRVYESSNNFRKLFYRRTSSIGPRWILVTIFVERARAEKIWDNRDSTFQIKNVRDVDRKEFKK